MIEFLLAHWRPLMYGGTWYIVSRCALARIAIEKEREELGYLDRADVKSWAAFALVPVVPEMGLLVGVIFALWVLPFIGLATAGERIVVYLKTRARKPK